MASNHENEQLRHRKRQYDLNESNEMIGSFLASEMSINHSQDDSNVHSQHILSDDQELESDQRSRSHLESTRRDGHNDDLELSQNHIRGASDVRLIGSGDRVDNVMRHSRLHSMRQRDDSRMVGRVGRYGSHLPDANLDSYSGLENGSQSSNKQLSLMIPTMDYTHERQQSTRSHQLNHQMHHETRDIEDTQHSQHVHQTEDVDDEDENNGELLADQFVDTEGNPILRIEAAELGTLSSFAANALGDLISKPQHVLAQSNAMQTLQDEANTPSRQNLLMEIGVPHAIFHHMKRFASCDPRVADAKAALESASRNGGKARRKRPRKSNKIDRHLLVGETLQVAYLSCLITIADTLENKVKLGSLGVCDVLSALADVYVDSEAVHEYMAALIRCLASSSTTSAILVTGGIHSVLSRAMERFPDSRKVQFEVAEAIRLLGGHPDSHFPIAESGIGELLLQTLINFQDDLPLLLATVGALGNLAALPINRKPLHKAGATMAISRVMSRYRENTQVVEKCSGAILNLSNNSWNQRSIVNTNVPEVILQAMRGCPTDYRVQNSCFLALNNLAMNPVNSDELIRVGVPEVIVEIADYFPNSEAMHGTCVSILVLLCQEGKTESLERLVDAGIDIYVMQTIEKFAKRDSILQDSASALQHIAPVANVNSVGRAISILHRALSAARVSSAAQVACVAALEKYATRMSMDSNFTNESVFKVDICGLLLKLLTKFPKNEQLVIHVCGTFEQLAKVNVGCTPRMMISDGVGRAIVKVMTRYQSAEVTCMAMIRSMSGNDSGVQLAFVRAGAGNVILTTLLREPTDTKLVTECLTTLLCLVKAPQAEALLVRKGALNAMSHTLLNVAHDENLIIQCATILECLTVTDAHQRKVMKTDIPDQLIQAMITFPQSFNVQKSCAGVLWNLSICKDNRIKLVHNLDAGRTLLNALRRFPSNPYIIEVCAGAIGELSMMPKNRAVLNEQGAVSLLDSTLQSLEGHSASQKNLQSLVACALKFLD